MIPIDYEESLRTMAGMASVVMNEPGGFTRFDEWINDLKETYYAQGYEAGLIEGSMGHSGDD